MVDTRVRTVPFTTAAIRALKPSDKRVTFHDLDRSYQGLSVVVSPPTQTGRDGLKTFVFRVHGHPHQTIGHFPAVSVKDARRMAAQWRLQINAGGDPIGKIKRAKAELRRVSTDVPTYAEAWAEYDDQKLVANSHGYRKMLNRIVAKHFLPVHGLKAVGSLVTRDWKQFREEHEVTRPGVTQNLKAGISSWHVWMAEKSKYDAYVDGPPKMGKVQRAGTGVRTRKLTLPSDIRRYWRALHNFDKRHATLALLKFLFLSNKRGIEVTRMTIDQIDFERGIWTITGDMNKSKREVRQPLTPLMLAIIREAMGERTQGHVFISVYGNKVVPQDAQLHQWLCEFAQCPRISTHDYRRTISSAMEDMGIPARVISLTEGHFDQGIEVHYQQGGVRKLDDMLEAYVAWQAFLEQEDAGRGLQLVAA